MKILEGIVGIAIGTCSCVIIIVLLLTMLWNTAIAHPLDLPIIDLLKGIKKSRKLS